MFSVGLTRDPAVGRGGFTVLPTYSLDDAPLPDLVVIPGGAGTRPLLKNDAPAGVGPRARRRGRAAAVGVHRALVLGAAGLLERRSATTHHDAYDELAAISPTTKVVRGQRFVRSERERS